MVLIQDEKLNYCRRSNLDLNTWLKIDIYKHDLQLTTITNGLEGS